MADLSDFPVYEPDIFSNEGIQNPYPHYEAIRELGPVVKLTPWDALAVGRYDEVRAIMMDHKRFISGQGVAMNDEGNAAIAGRGTLTNDQPIHTRNRTTLFKPLSPKAMQDLKDEVKTEADGLIDRLVEKGRFDGVTDLSQYLPLTIVSKLVGVPEAARQNMLLWAAAAFNDLGPANEIRQQALPNIAGILNFINNCGRDQLTPGSWGAQLFEAADREEIPYEVAGQMILDYVAPSLDTTIAGTASMLVQLSENPEQWNLIKEDPSLIRNAVDETLRIQSPIRGFSRLAAENVELSGVTIPEGAWVFILWASANRDEAMFENANTFNVKRDNSRKHMAFGFGIHQCAGQHLARLEMMSLLEAMVAKVDKIEVSNPKYVLNNTLRVLESIDVTFS